MAEKKKDKHKPKKKKFPNRRFVFARIPAEKRRKLFCRIGTAAAALILIALIPLMIYASLRPGNAASAIQYTGKTVCMGVYPQSRVTDGELTRRLLQQPLNWTAFEDCYAGGNNYGTAAPMTGMKYADLEYEGSRYRAVSIESYRPQAIINSSAAGYSYQDDNGYESGKTYFFLYEPIRWHVIGENQRLLLTEKVLDAMQFSNSFYWIDRDSDGSVDWASEFSSRRLLFLPANLYKTSGLRTWLNNGFFSAAFSEAEQKLIKSGLRRSDESSAQAKYGLNAVSSNRVWLLSAAEAQAWRDSGADDDACFPAATDYAECRGAFSGAAQNRESAWWWLRSPGDYSGDVISVVDSPDFLTPDRQFFQAYTVGGVRCAVCLKSSSATQQILRDQVDRHEQKT